MKIKNILWGVAAISAMLLTTTSCKDETLHTGLEEGPNGTLSTANMSLEVTNGETEIRSSRAVNVDEFQITITRGESTVKSTTYGELPSTIVLDVADNYTIKAESGICQKAAFDAPYFVGSQKFEIKKDEVTEVEPVVCKLANVKVSIKYTDALKKVLGDDVRVTVTANNGGTLEFFPTETRSGYFEYVDASFTMVVKLEGTIAGGYETVTQFYKDFAPGQHRIITFGLKGASGEIPDETGNITGDGVDIDVSYTTQDLTMAVKPGEDGDLGDDGRPGSDDNTGDSGDDPGDDPTPGDNTISFSSDFFNLAGNNYVSEVISKIEAGEKAAVQITTENPIEQFNVEIKSDNQDFLNSAGGLMPLKFDLAKDDDETKKIASVGLPFGDKVKGQTSVLFDITELAPLLEAFPGKHIFELVVVDDKRNENGMSLVIIAE